MNGLTLHDLILIIVSLWQTPARVMLETANGFCLGACMAWMITGWLMLIFGIRKSRGKHNA